MQNSTFRFYEPSARNRSDRAALRARRLGGAITTIFLALALATPGWSQNSHWPMDRLGPAEDLIDSNHASSAGGSLPDDEVDGVFGSAVEFDGVDQWLQMADDATMNPLAGSVMLWARANTAGGNEVVLYQSDWPTGEPIDYNGFGSDGDVLEMHLGKTSSWSFYYQDGATPGVGRFSVNGGTVQPGRWTHLAATWDRSGDLVLYVDCVEVDRVSLTSGSFSNHSANFASMAAPAEGGRLFDGAIDSVRVFDDAMPQRIIDLLCARPDDQATEIFRQLLVSRTELEDDWLAVGGSTTAGNHESVWVLPRNGDQFGTPTELVPANFSGVGLGGKRVALSGDTLVAAEDVGATPNHLWIWRVDGNGTWQEIEEFIHPTDALAAFARVVDLDGDWLAVSSSTTGDGRVNEVNLYQRSGGTWSFNQTIVSPESPTASSRFGTALALEGSVLAVAETNSGNRVHVYRLSGPTWQLEQTLEAESLGSDFGQAVDLSDGLLAVAHPGARVEVSTEGEVLLYRATGVAPDVWQLQGTLEAPIPQRVERFGEAIAFEDGRALVATDDAFDLRSAVHRFRESPGGGWRYQDTLQPPGLVEGAFGDALAVDERLAIVGERGNSGLPTVPAWRFLNPVFSDDFESGGLSAWSASTP